MQAKDIEKALQEEQWTRAQIGTFTLGSFQQLDEMVTGLDDDTQNEVKSFCDKFLGENPKSVVALYVSGSIALVRHSQEDNINLLNLIEMFRISRSGTSSSSSVRKSCRSARTGMRFGSLQAAMSSKETKKRCSKYTRN